MTAADSPSAISVFRINLETGMERDEDGVMLGSTRLPGSQRLHRKGDATREAGCLVGPMTAADSPSAISVFRLNGFVALESLQGHSGLELGIMSFAFCFHLACCIWVVFPRPQSP
jgi:hypothetical protein